MWEETEQYIRSGHRSLDEFQPQSLRTIDIDIGNGIKAVVGKCIGSDAIEVLSYLFSREKGWTLEKAKAWFEDHIKNVSEGFRWIQPVYGILKNILAKAGGRLLKIVATHADIRNRNDRIYGREELVQAARTLSGKRLNINIILLYHLHVN